MVETAGLMKGQNSKVELSIIKQHIEDLDVYIIIFEVAPTLLCMVDRSNSMGLHAWGRVLRPMCRIQHYDSEPLGPNNICNI